VGEEMRERAVPVRVGVACRRRRVACRRVACRNVVEALARLAQAINKPLDCPGLGMVARGANGGG
jgi:hypothetical protein